MAIDFQRKRTSTLQPVIIKWTAIEQVQSYKYLGVHLDEKLDWALNTDAVYKKTQSRLFFLRRLRSFDVCSQMLHMFYQSAVASVLFYAAVCWGSSIRDKDVKRLNKLVKKAGSVLGESPDSLETVVERCTHNKRKAIMVSVSHPLHNILAGQKSSRKDLFR